MYHSKATSKGNIAIKGKDVDIDGAKARSARRQRRTPQSFLLQQIRNALSGYQLAKGTCLWDKKPSTPELRQC